MSWVIADQGKPTRVQVGQEQRWEAGSPPGFGSLPGGSWARLPVALQKRWQLRTSDAWIRRHQRAGVSFFVLGREFALSGLWPLSVLGETIWVCVHVLCRTRAGCWSYSLCADLQCGMQAMSVAASTSVMLTNWGASRSMCGESTWVCSGWWKLLSYLWALKCSWITWAKLLWERGVVSMAGALVCQWQRDPLLAPGCAHPWLFTEPLVCCLQFLSGGWYVWTKDTGGISPSKPYLLLPSHVEAEFKRSRKLPVAS